MGEDEKTRARRREIERRIKANEMDRRMHEAIREGIQPSVMGHAEPISEEKRKALFELNYKRDQEERDAKNKVAYDRRKSGRYIADDFDDDGELIELEPLPTEKNSRRKFIVNNNQIKRK